MALLLTVGLWLVLVKLLGPLHEYALIPAGPVSESELPIQRLVLDAVAVAVAAVLTETVACAKQPALLVYVITVLPAATPVTTPVLLTVAYGVFEDVHGLEPAGVPDPVSVVVDPIHTLSVPDMVAPLLTVTVDWAEHPALLV